MRVEEWQDFEIERPCLDALLHMEPKHEVNEQYLVPAKREKISLRQVGKEFRVPGGRIEALSAVDLSVAEGEFVCLVGPSGCGKSTLLNIIAGLERPSKGRVSACGRPVTGAGPDRILIFQEPALFPWLTIQENVEFGLKIRGLSRQERTEKALEGLRQVGLVEFARAYVHQLSGGMKQRASLARALVLEPELLLLDEPFAALDAQSREVLHQELLDAWARTGKTIVFVTHNVAEALRLADRIVVFSARPGRIVREFPVGSERPRRLERDDLTEIGEAIRDELRLALSGPAREESGRCVTA